MGGGGEPWSPDEKLCYSLLRRIPTTTASAATLPLLSIHAFILRRSFDSNLPLLTLLISSLSSLLSLLPHALLAFHHRRTQDTHLINTVIKSLVRHRRFRHSLSLFRRLRPSFSPDSHTFPSLLKSVASLADPPSHFEGPQLHSQTLRSGFAFDVFSATALVDMYAKLGELSLAGKVFDEMPHRTPASWNPMIMGHVRSGDIATAMEMFYTMPEKDAATFNVMIDGFVKLGDVGSARRLLNEMPELKRNVVSWTSLIHGYCRAGDMGAARALFDGMGERRNLYSWNVMISGYCRNRQPERAVELFRKLQSVFCPDEVTIVSVMPAIADMGAIDLARWIHSYVRRKGMDRRVNICNGLVGMYARCGDVEEARRVFDGMLVKETVSWNAMINGLAVNGRAREALDVFAAMERNGVRPNELTMIGVLSACSHGGLVEEGRRWFRDMEVLEIDRRVEHYGCMVDLLGRGGYLEEAEKLVDEMPYETNGIIMSSLMFACQNCGDVDRAERVMRRAMEIEPGNATNYVMIRNLYAAQDRWGDVKRIKEVMGRFGGKLEAGCSVVEVQNMVCEFVSGDKGHPEMKVIQQALAHLQLHMKAKDD